MEGRNYNVIKRILLKYKKFNKGSMYNVNKIDCVRI